MEIKQMNILITGGNTAVPIDKVRCISNIFAGNTACNIAKHFINNKIHVTLVGNPNMKHLIFPKCTNDILTEYLTFKSYKTYDDLMSLMKDEITNNHYDVVIHSAAVSDYKVDDTLVKDNGELVSIDKSSKIGSSHKELYLKLVPTEKIIDKIKSEWGYKGKLVKFKLQVGISISQLLNIAFESCKQSNADFIVANCLEWSKEKAYIATPGHSAYEVKRDDLPAALLMYLSK